MQPQDGAEVFNEFKRRLRLSRWRGVGNRLVEY